jgi:molecular chaperone DnaK
MTPLPDNAIAVGIDLGTTYSVVAMVDEFGQPQIIPNSDNERTTPSVVYIDGNSALVGKIAKEQTHIFAHNTAQFIKPHIGRRRKRFQLGDQEWSAEELSAIILRKVVQDAEAALGGDKKITHAVITVPAFFTEQQRKSTEDAGRIAGLEVIGIINEPTAAALAYGFDTLGVDKTVVVYDLGGGTFDVTVMRISGDAITMLATDGDVQLGGKDWDERIIEHCAEQFQTQFGDDPRDAPDVLQALYGQAEQAKQRLSKLPTTRLSVMAHGKHLNVDLTRDQFEALTEDLLAQTETTLSLAVEEAGLGFGQVNECLLVGGSTRMPAVRGMLARRLGAEPKHLINPDECVALGASIHSLMLQLRQTVKGREVPPPHVHEDHLARFRQMQERLINAHTLGIVALNAEGQQVIVPIIPRRTFIPRREIKIFRTPHDGQTQIRIIVMEGEGERPEACVELGTCLIRGLPEGLPKGTPIEVCFECTDDGRLEVTARLPTLEQSVQTQIARTMGMSDAEIDASRERLARLAIQ